MMNPRYPVYIPSKGRWEARLSQRTFEGLGMKYYVVVEPQEAENYQRVTNKEFGTVLVLPFSNLGQGCAPARNWIKQHSIEVVGAARHWQVDDDMRCFYRFHQNRQIKVADGTIFRCVEDFSDRYENIALSGMHDWSFFPRKTKAPPFYVNRRVYTTTLVNNAIPHRWRGPYNDDTDMNIRVMKDGWCVVNFVTFLADTEETVVHAGGMTELYKKSKGKEDGRLKMARALQAWHPDITTITWKFSHWQHQVDYTVFDRNELKLKPGVVIPEEPNNYGMELVEIK